MTVPVPRFRGGGLVSWLPGGPKNTVTGSVVSLCHGEAGFTLSVKFSLNSLSSASQTKLNQLCNWCSWTETAEAHGKSLKHEPASAQTEAPLSGPYWCPIVPRPCEPGQALGRRLFFTYGIRRLPLSRRKPPTQTCSASRKPPGATQKPGSPEVLRKRPNDICRTFVWLR